jgi:hypothetical protein
MSLRSARPRAAPCARAFIELALSRGSDWLVIASASAITNAAWTRALTRSSAPAGSRCIPVISAPDIVVGIAATRAPLTDATAFAVSMTRPPPRATRFSAPVTPSSAAAASGTPPGATS